ncbi:MAG: hypothetical protein AAFN40_05180 [Cyanobacteria bacterium J06560_6]
MSDPVLSQLVSVESDLSEQVEQIESQLSQLQAQRQSLLTVIDLFQVDGESAVANKDDSSPAQPSPDKAPAARSKTKTQAKTKKKPATKRASSGRKTTASTSGRKKKDGRAAAWQKHVKPEYRDLALPESVSSVLRSQPSEIFKIADVMSSIFKEDVPRTSYLKARNRISNILSAGARDGTWYRGSNGRYSQSEKVTKL